MLQVRPTCSGRGQCAYSADWRMLSADWRLPCDIQILSFLLSQAAGSASLVTEWHVLDMVACLEHTEGAWTCLQIWSFMDEATASFPKQGLA